MHTPSIVSPHFETAGRSYHLLAENTTRTTRPTLRSRPKNRIHSREISPAKGPPTLTIIALQYLVPEPSQVPYRSRTRSLCVPGPWILPSHGNSTSKPSPTRAVSVNPSHPGLVVSCSHGSLSPTWSCFPLIGPIDHVSLGSGGGAHIAFPSMLALLVECGIIMTTQSDCSWPTESLCFCGRAVSRPSPCTCRCPIQIVSSAVGSVGYINPVKAGFPRRPIIRRRLTQPHVTLRPQPFEKLKPPPSNPLCLSFTYT